MKNIYLLLICLLSFNLVSCDSKESNDAAPVGTTHSLLLGRWNSISTKDTRFDKLTNQKVEEGTTPALAGDYILFTETETTEYVQNVKSATLPYKLVDNKRLDLYHDGQVGLSLNILELTKSKLVLQEEFISVTTDEEKNGDKIIMETTYSK